MLEASGTNRLAVVPYAEGCDEGDESWPANLGLDTGHFEFRIMQVAGYKEVFAKYLGAGAMTNLDEDRVPSGFCVNDATRSRLQDANCRPLLVIDRPLNRAPQAVIAGCEAR